MHSSLGQIKLLPPGSSLKKLIQIWIKLIRIWKSICFAIQGHLIHLTFMPVFKGTLDWITDPNTKFQDNQLNPPLRRDQDNPVFLDQINPKSSSKF